MAASTTTPLATDSLTARPPQTFASEDDRKRLTPTALEAVRNLAKSWDVTGDEMAALLGVSSSTWDRIRSASWRQSLSQDQLTRASAMIGVFKGLHLLFADGMADRWIKLRNSGPLFSNRSPIETMIEGGIPAMLEVRRYVDALRGGL
ncbi:hypothetical protein GJW-30_1_04263 [Variibacter gotjawalensis]|uniref:Antitoxin Xre-like helix-turn-helix domain-containing protein n=1 Tax=Variibacter gotjawalensis TaxID=1333996 RepID=A0A0S3Q0H5_9BRAD|nr:antitoxin Xre-like helix-turn-helix domain-containing protein [Variibacter gotjawalensis]NIK47543.1 uncharacterized protein (DUF2384 family) [Variibacter gotjawalensis]RZS49440.1 hypothetical protein EV661_1873 [Variibacter gotjawalensis]BAT61703.1 hypothetical protein GJW-30_1_04263 [Variibacter gotjawalensis]